MRAVQLLGRILFGGFFVYSGINHLLHTEMMTGYAASKGVPLANAAVLASGLIVLVGGAMILVGWKPHWGAWLVVIFLLPVTVMMHQFWAADPAYQMMEMANFTKNMALLGAALMIATIKYWPISVERPAVAAL